MKPASLLRTVLLGALVSVSGALAGGSGPISRLDVLRWVPGVQTRAELALPNPHQATNRVTVGVRGQPVTIWLTLGLSGPAGRQQPEGGLNDLMAWVSGPAAGAAEREALMRVAATYLRVCAGFTAAQVQPVRVLAAHPWPAGRGLVEQTFGAFRVGRSAGDGLTIAGRDYAGVTANWPAARSRCEF